MAAARLHSHLAGQQLHGQLAPGATLGPDASNNAASPRSPGGMNKNLLYMIEQMPEIKGKISEVLKCKDYTESQKIEHITKLLKTVPQKR